MILATLIPFVAAQDRDQDAGVVCLGTYRFETLGVEFSNPLEALVSSGNPKCNPNCTAKLPQSQEERGGFGESHRINGTMVHLPTNLP